MPLSNNKAGPMASNPTGGKTSTTCEPAPIAGHTSAGMLNHALNRHSEELSSTCSSSDAPGNSGSTSTASCGMSLLWQPEDDRSVDQDDGWQVVAGKSTTKGPGQHHHHQEMGCSCSSTGVPNSLKGQVCGRCGMRGHLSAKCKQPHCSKCSKWWHTEEECAKACNTCGSLDHRVCGASLCKSYKCRECGLYGHVYAECPNIRCNLCSEVGHKALECPSIVCNICKQKGHKAINCTAPRHSSSYPAAASKPAAASSAHSVLDVQQPTPVTIRQLQHCSSSSSSVTSPVSVLSPRAPAVPAGSTTSSAAAGNAAAAAAVTSNSNEATSEVPMVQQLPRPSNLAEQQQVQQQHSRLLAQLLKVAPDVAANCLDDCSKLQALYLIEPQYLRQLLQASADRSPELQRRQLEAAVSSAQRQLEQRLQHQQQQSGQATAVRGNQLPPSAAGTSVQRRLAMGGSVSPAPQAPAAAASPVEDVTDATQGIKPGDLAPQHAKQLVAEFGDMLPSRWQQLPSWRQLEARLSFPDGNYVQRRLQFREKRRQLQLLTLQLRSAAATAKPQGQAAANSSRASGVAALTGRATAHTRVVPETPAAAAASVTQQQPPASKPAGSTPCSYAAALAGKASAAGVNSVSPCSSSSSSQPVPGSPFAADSAAAVAAAASAAAGVGVCSRCGMMGHVSTSCVQPRCSRCHLWWHTEAQCSSACQFCGSLDHTGDAEQPASCKSFKCKACRMFGHTQSICPHVQLHSQQLQRQSSSFGGSSSSSVVPPASPLSSRGPGTAGSSSNGSEASSICPPDSPGLGQQGVKPKDLLPEHAKALQDEFPNALPPGWQQMGSWRMVEERLRVVAVEGAVFSKRRQMWRDRRKHYQALTAQALAAAARSAAAASVAAAEETAAATAAAERLAADRDRNKGSTGQRLVGDAKIVPDTVQHVNMQQQQCQNVGSQQQVEQDSGSRQLHGQQLLDQQDNIITKQQEQQNSQQEADRSPPARLGQHHQQPHDLPANQQCSMDPVLIPEWQQQQGSLFGLVDAAPGSMPMDSTATGSAFSCDTHFSSSPTPASHTPTVMLSPFVDRLGFSGGSTPGPASANSSNVVTPAAASAGLAGTQGCSSLPMGMSSPMPAPACNTPVPTPRSAAAAAAAAAATGSVSSAAAYTSAGMGMSVDAGRFSPMAMPQSSAAGVMRSPMGHPAMYGAVPTSPMEMHNAAAAAAMAGGRPAGGNMYQHMVQVAQRQSQLQQQLMLQQGRYTRPMEQSPYPHQQQMLLQMQLQQQQQQQMRMQRQCRMDQAFLVQHQIRQHQQHQQQYQKLQGKGMMAMGAADETAETGELDDTLGVLGVLGLQ